MNYEVKAEKLRRTINPDALGIKNTEGLEPLKEIIGQKRAVDALQFGLQIGGQWL